MRPRRRSRRPCRRRPEGRRLPGRHPDVAAELTKVKGLPKDQRRAELKAWRQANPQEAQDLKAARQAVIDYHKSCPRQK
ncbi:hemophore-related protein [Nocardia seriolae]|uniref:hemophore-related protein n=1 Tax=Nocardia seriolae TaxID=37332 RepID=UPI000CD7E115